MWRPPINFVTLHYAYIIFMSVLGLIVLYPGGNMAAVDAYFFGASGSTESGLNTVDVKDLKLYQQLYIYFIPIITNLGFINILVVVVRIWWFNKHLKKAAPSILSRRQADDDEDAENATRFYAITNDAESQQQPQDDDDDENNNNNNGISDHDQTARTSSEEQEKLQLQSRIKFDATAEKDNHPRRDTALYIPGPIERDQGHPFVEMKAECSFSKDDMSIAESLPGNDGPSSGGLRRRVRLDETRSMERVASFATSMFVIGSEPGKPQRRMSNQSHQQPSLNDAPFLSSQATVGRNSQFHNMTAKDKAELGGIEYRSLKLLLKIVIGYFFGLHLFGAICLVGWIQYADSKYINYLEECGQNRIWWAFYSSQTMIDNLGFTLTPDSMITFRDASWPMFIMSFLAFAGNTLYPCFLRLSIWTMSKLSPKHSSTQQSLNFLLQHPRRCYTLLFPSGTTWALFGIIFVLNFVDALFIIVLDLDNPEVTALPVGPRILAAIFQAASSRHTGTATFNLAVVNPAVQFSLLVMMYIAIFPVAVAVRASNTYEERSLGVYEKASNLNEQKGYAYLITHMQNQLSFDLWYMFLGIFCICIAESSRIMDEKEPAFAIFPVFFEVVSAYGNVGLSLGYPTVATSLSGKFTTFSKLVVCAMMIRGRHRGLPYQLDRAIMLPEEQRLIDDSNTDE